MIIKELHLMHFGKFHDFKIELGPHMNLIFGGNEAGKSTVCAFIYGMLFGIRRQRGRAAASDMYTRYKPWQTPASYEGAILFEHEGKNYRLYRNFYKDEASVNLMCLDTHKEIPLAHGVISDFIPALTEENYRNTVGVSQTKSKIDESFARSLQSQAANMSMTGSQNLHLGRALEYLDKERRILKKQGKQEQIQVKLKEIHRLETELAMADGTQNLQQSGDAIERIQAQLQKIDRELDACNLSLGMAIKDKERLEAQLKSEPLDTPKEPSDELKQRSGEGGKQRLAPALGAIALVAGIVLGGAGIAMHKTMPYAFLIFCFLACVILLIFGIYGCALFGQRKKGLHKTKTGVPDAHLVEDRASKERKTSLGSDTRGEKIPGGPLIREVLQALEEANGRKVREESRRSLLKQERQKLLEKREQCREADLRRAADQEKYQEKINKLEDCREELEQFYSLEKAAARELLCVETAKQLIQELAGEIHENFGSRLLDQTEMLMERLTGASRGFHIDQDLKISIDNSKEFIPMERLSHGTMEQFYLALRLGAARVLFGDSPVPLVLDDTFAYYDDQRLRGLLDWMAQELPAQILLLSCQPREGEMMDAMDMDYNYVNLSGQI